MMTLQQVRRDAPWQWLQAGWRDFVHAPVVCLTYGGIFVLLGFMITLGLAALGFAATIPVALGGFALVAPVFAVGIYQVSRAFERGETPRFRIIISRFPSRIAQIAFLSFLLALLLLVWMRVAQILHIIITPDSPREMGAFLNFLLTDSAGLTLLAIGSVFGAALATLAFAISAIAFPMMVDRDVDAITALATSFNAVKSQPFVMLTWAWLIAFIIGAGIAVVGVGLAVAFPWIALATWHAYRDFIPAE